MTQEQSPKRFSLRSVLTLLSAAPAFAGYFLVGICLSITQLVSGAMFLVMLIGLFFEDMPGRGSGIYVVLLIVSGVTFLASLLLTIPLNRYARRHADRLEQGELLVGLLQSTSQIWQLLRILIP